MEPPLRQADLSGYLSRPSEPELQFRRLFHSGERLVICDIGACEGEDSVRYARAYPRARVFAFEPLPANQDLARDNLRRYSADNAELVPVALSEREGEATFHVSSGRPPSLFAGEDWNYGNKSSSLLPPAGSAPMHGWVEFKQAITVRTDTLDGFCMRRGIEQIDFIQMDVQGAERMVLEGARRMLPRTTAVWLEVAERENYRGQALAGDIGRLMRSRGFRLCFRVRRDDGSGEGDDLYLNLRSPRTWRYAALRPARALAGRIKRRILSSAGASKT